MCGIVGYIGKNDALPILLDSLKRLEYRGYDSAGVAVKTAAGVFSVKAVGRIVELEKKIGTTPPYPPLSGGSLGIAHTRWATHGAPTEANAHPQVDCQNKIGRVGERGRKNQGR